MREELKAYTHTLCMKGEKRNTENPTTITTTSSNSSINKM
jgi:hypothetical protein